MNIEEAREIIIDEILNDTFLLSAFNQDASFESRQIKADAIETVLNELDKKDKEIEELKKPKYLLNAKTGEITTINNSEFISKDKIKAKIGKRMQKNNNTIHNAKLKHGKDYVYYDDVQEAKEENRICKEILQSLLEKE